VTCPGDALIAANTLAWECKQNFPELVFRVRHDDDHHDDQLTETFKLLRGDDPARWFESHTHGNGLGVRALINEIAGISRTR